jgi:hypothetical protein
MSKGYVELLQERRLALAVGDEKRAQELLEQAQRLLQDGKVSDDEILASTIL